MDQRKITAGVFGAVLLIVSLVLYSPLVTASDVIYREYVAHCDLAGGKTTLVAHNQADTSDTLTLTQTSATATTCTLPAGTNAATYLTEDGAVIGTMAATAVAIVVTGSTWQQPSGVLQTFSSINTLLVSLLPLVIIIGFLGTAAAGLYNYAMSTAGSLQSAIKTEIITLIVALVVIYLMPVVLDQLTDASTTTDGRLSVTGSFKSIIDLIFGIMPIALTIGIFGLVTYRGVQTFRGKGGAMGGGMM